LLAAACTLFFFPTLAQLLERNKTNGLSP
jgi:hypothetical protein